MAALDLVLDGDPANKSALDIVPRMRDAVANLPPGVTALVGGGSAINYDIDNANQRDLELIVPLALIVMAVILGDPPAGHRGATRPARQRGRSHSPARSASRS